MHPRHKHSFDDIAHRAYCNALHELLPDRYTRKMDLSNHLRRLFELYRIDCVFDVGANLGQYRNFLRRRCAYDELLISFEPVRANAEALLQRSQWDPKWVVRDIALGDQNGQLEINVMANSEFSSFRAPNSAAVPEYTEQNSVVAKELVQVRRLDDVVQELSDKYGFETFYLKLDTQGFDRAVLEGAGASLERVPALQTEISVLKLYEDAPNYLEMVTYLNGLGFELSGLFPVNRDKYERVIEFDCVAVNRRFFPRVAGAASA